jgi:ATP/maltotriose-dependent transcriptional regulator MalT
MTGDADEMRRHLERATELGAETGLPAARCESLALLAVHAARLGASGPDEELLGAAERSAITALDLASSLSGHPPWPAQARAALATVALARGRIDEAADHARSALGLLQAALHEDAYLDVLLPATNALVAADAAEAEQARAHLRLTLAMVVQRTLDEDVRVRWLRGPVGRELSRLAGPIAAEPAEGHDAEDGSDDAFLRRLVQGKTNAEIASELGIDEDALTRRLSELFARIGASSRAEATAFAFQQRVL